MFGGVDLRAASAVALQGLRWADARTQLAARQAVAARLAGAHRTDHEP